MYPTDLYWYNGHSLLILYEYAKFLYIRGPYRRIKSETTLSSVMALVTLETVTFGHETTHIQVVP